MVDIGNIPEAVIFDYGFVLTASTDQQAFRARQVELAAEYGFKKAGHLWGHIYESKAWNQAKVGQISDDEFWQDRLAPLGIEDPQDILAFQRRLFEYASGIHPDMRQLVEELRPKVRLAVLSNISIRDMKRWLADEHGMDGIFEVVVGSADEGIAKPNPAIYHLVLERLNLPPEKALFIDDLSRNTEAAEALGLPSIRFETPAALREELQERRIL